MSLPRLPHALFVAALCLGLPVASPAQTPMPKPERVQFAKGASFKVIKGTIRGDQSRLFLVNIAADQMIHVTLQSSNNATNFNVTAPRAQQAMFIGSTSGTQFDDAAPVSGDYRVDLYLMRAAARRNEAATFTLTIGAGR